eukprot:TRINITY_DN1358_c0_g1_i2.p1 TRINITY_DN1358_c0_g1~~TRINITY_DN1358_c0_g1_i2.p1  ORF type:complete len:539 (+),score=107.01 TRINITY_DN1358_c0_g1_i2:370-1986(+)
MGGSGSRFESASKASRIGHNPINEAQFLEKHTDIVRYLVNIDGRRIASAGDDGTVCIWDTLTGQCLKQLKGHGLRITGMLSLLCGSERILATGSADKTVRLWSVDSDSPPQPSTHARDTHACTEAEGEDSGEDTPSNCCRHVLSGHTGSITCLYAMDNETLCSGGNDSMIYLWRVRDGTAITRIERQEEENLHCLLPIANNSLVTGSNSSFLYVYDIKTSKHQVLAYHRESVRCLVSISDTQFASASLDGAIVVWHAQNLTPIKTLTYPEQYLDGTTKAFLFSVRKLVLLSKRYIAAAFGNGFKIFDISTRECILSEANCHEGPVTDLIPLYDCRRLVTCSVNGCIRIWGIEQQHPVPALTNVPDPKQAPLTSSMKRNVRAVCFGEMWCHADAVNSLLYMSPSAFASCSHDGTVVLWKDGRVQSQLRLRMARMWQEMHEHDTTLTASPSGGDGAHTSMAPHEATSGPLVPPPAGVSTHSDRVAKPVVPASTGVPVPEYILDYALMLRDEKNFSVEQVRECMQEMGHSESIIKALLLKL